MTPIHAVLAMLVALVWGVQFVIIKLGLEAFPPLFFVALRFAAAAAILLPFVGRPTRGEIVPIIAVSVFSGGLNFGLVFLGLARGQAGMSALANQLAIPFTILLAWPILGERPSARVVVGVAIAFAGVALTAAERGAPVAFVPTLLVAVAGLAWAVGNVLTKRLGPFEPLKLMAWMSLLTVPQLAAASAAFEHGQLASLHAAGAVAWAAFAYTVVFGAVAGWGLWFWLIAHCPMSRLAPFALLQTVFAIAAGAFFLKEPLTPTLAAGAAVCIAGVAIAQGRPPARPDPAAIPRSAATSPRGSAS